MSDPALLHLVLGAALAIPGVLLIVNRKLVLGWILAALGTVIGLVGVIAPAIHHHLHH